MRLELLENLEQRVVLESVGRLAGGVVMVQPSKGVDRSVLERVIAVLNGKGGVGKTTVTANVSGLLAKSGYRVLVGDIDPQGNLGFDLGYADTARDDRGKSLASALLFGSEIELLRDVRPGLDVIVGGSALHHVAASLAAGAGKVDPRDALAAVLQPIASDYDVIMLDCPPLVESLQQTAIGAARWVVVPVKMDKGGARGLEEVAERLESVVEVNPALDLLGVLLFDLEAGASVIRQRARDGVAETVGSADVLFDAVIRHSSKVAQQARDRGMLVHELDEYAREQPEWWQVRRGEASAADMAPRTAANVADDLYALTSEIVARLTARESQEVPA